MIFSPPPRLSPTRWLALFATAMAVMLVSAPVLEAREAPAAGEEALTLRINDAEAEPGGLAAVVIRTYSSRPVGTGQLCFIGGCGGVANCRGGFVGERMISYLEGHLVFSTAGDVQSEVTATRPNPNVIDLAFISESATVNATDGPLAVIFLRVPQWVTPGAAVNLDLVRGGTELTDAEGLPVPLDVRPGVLRIRGPRQPRALLADGDRIQPGQVATLAIETLEPFALSSGRVVLYYDPAIADGPPEVRFEPRLGNASFVADVTTPGVVVIDFESPDASLNRIPGGLITLRLPTAATVPAGTLSPIVLDERETYVRSKGLGQPPLRLVNGEIEFE